MPRRLIVTLLASAFIGCLAASSSSEGKGGPCPPGMAHIAVEGAPAYCIDRWEAQVVEVKGKSEVAHAPTQPVTNLSVRAVTKAGVTPQGYISKNEAEAACKASKKRLCKGVEWDRACRGKTPTAFPYGDERKTGYCNDSGRAPIAALHPELADVYASGQAMNDPRINEAPNTVAPTGSFTHCRNAFGVYDMVGNLHEWVADVHDGSRGTFRGGYYQDTHLNGDGCTYRTTAHDVSYHDYSTGFRCCADAK
jgi:sulfatase modifying factor 1